MIQQLCSNTGLYSLVCEPLSYGFMQRAFFAIIMLSIVSGVVGAYVVVRGMAFLTDALAHAMMPGVAIAYITGGVHGPLLLGATIAAGITALIIGFFTRGGKFREDTAIGIVFTGALALGLAILSIHKTTAVDLETLLIGNVLALNGEDLLFIFIVGLFVLFIIRALYKEFLIISFDPVLGATLQYPIETLRYVLLLVIAMTAVIAIEAVGVILIAALLVTPSATAYLLTRRLHIMMLWSAVIACLSGIVGIFASWHFRLAPSAAIVLTMTAVFLIVYFFAPKRGLLWAKIGRTKESESTGAVG
jgi:manganese/iron transport system permease protein